MFERTNHKRGPWTAVHADSKKQARINMIRDLLQRSEYKGKRPALLKTDRRIILPVTKALLKSDALSK